MLFQELAGDMEGLGQDSSVIDTLGAAFGFNDRLTCSLHQMPARRLQHLCWKQVNSC